MEKKKAKSTKSTKAKAKKKVTEAKVVKEVEKKNNTLVEEVKEVKKEEKIAVEEIKQENKKDKRNDHSLFKILALIIIVVTILTWFIKSGNWTFDNSDVNNVVANFNQNEEVARQGINEFFLSFYYGINYYLTQLVFIAIIGVFFGVISKTKGYKKMIKKCASLFKNKETIFTLITSLIIAGLTSVVTQPVVVITLIPVFYSIAKELKINKVSTMMATFGALCVGLMGLTLGTFGINYAAQSMNLEFTTGMTNRVILLVVGYLLLNVFIVLFNKKKKNNIEVTEDVFEVTEDDSKGRAWPYFLLFIILIALIVLGYTPWTNIEIDVFDNFYSWLTTELLINDKPVFSYVLGNIPVFGQWEPFTICGVMLFALVFIKLFAKIKINDLLDNALEGLKKVAKPIVLVAMAYTVFVLCYWSGITTTIVNLFNQAKGFNVYLVSIGNAIADFLHVDVEYTGFALGQLYLNRYAANADQLFAVITATNGLVSFIAPTSVFMLIGLSFSKLSYKDYFKSIWKFLLALVIILAIILSVITYM